MSDAMLRIGVIGAGSKTVKTHIPNFQKIEGVEIVGVCNRSRESSERVARQFGIDKIYDNWLEAVEDPDTDAILIGTWPYLHHRATLAGLKADKHVLCEARMAMTAREAREMLAEAQGRPHLVAQLVPAPFTLGVDRVVARLLNEGYVGDILAIDVRVCDKFQGFDAPLHWRHDFDLCGFNAMGMGIWYESIMRWAGEAVRVTAMGRTFVRNRHDADGNLRAVRIPDHLDILADMACGAQARFQFSTVLSHPIPTEASLYGTEGTLRYVDGALFCSERGDEKMTEIPISENGDEGWRVEKEFIGAIRGEEQVRLTAFEDGVKYMEFSEAVARSMAEGKAVSLPLRE